MPRLRAAINVRVSPWAVLDLAGEQLFVLNALAPNTRGRIFSTSPSFQRSFIEKGCCEEGADLGLVDELVKMGAAESGVNGGIPAPHGPQKRHTQPFLEELIITVDLRDADIAGVTGQLLTVLQD